MSFSTNADGLRSVRCKAPLRISLAGGGTDVPPYPAEYGGAVLSATINLYARCLIRTADANTVTVRSLDLDQVATFESNSVPVFDGNLDLVKAVFRRLRVRQIGGLQLVLQCDAPPGSGLGSSSALVVAIVAALSKFFDLRLSPQEIARVAYVVERQDLGIAGGMQDQYSAAFGGLNYIEFSHSVEVMPIRLSESMRREFEEHMFLCFTGKTRSSSGILERQTNNVLDADFTTMEGLMHLKRLALELRRKLHTDDLDGVAKVLDEGWHYKKGLASGISNIQLEEIYQEAMANGATGGKLLGAGGGGYFLFLVDPERKEALARSLLPLGVTVTRGVELSDSGVTAWEVPQVRSELPSAFAEARS